MKPPETRYTRSGDVNIAYQVVGEGPFDLVYVPGAVSHVDLIWTNEERARFFSALARFARLIVFDKRGTGASDQVADAPDLETRMDDVRAVMEAAGSRRAAVMGVSEGGPLSLLFTATYPQRVRGLVVYGTFARWTWAPDYPWQPTRDETMRFDEEDVRLWGTVELARQWRPDASDVTVRQFAQDLRMMASPGAYAALARMNIEIDVRHVLSSIRVPTLVLHRAEDPISVENARYLAREIPAARYLELPGGPHEPRLGDWQRVVDEAENFLVPICTGPEEEAELERVLSTVLFTDIVDATAHAAELGDSAWRDLLRRHHEAVRRELSRFRGREVDTAGDGFFATFDGPARAIRSACAIRESVHELGLQVRAGLHTGECELMDSKVGGIAVHIGARVASLAEPGEVLVSSTVKDLVAGSGIEFEDRGEYQLKGISEAWHVFKVVR